VFRVQICLIPSSFILLANLDHNLWITITHRSHQPGQQAGRVRCGRPGPLTSLRSRTALCGLVGLPRKMELKKGNISQLLTEFGLFTGVNSKDINY
jgi:hypothetical protein